MGSVCLGRWLANLRLARACNLFAMRIHSCSLGVPVIAAAAPSRARLERRMRQRRLAKVVVAIALAVIWVPVAIVMLAAGMADRRG